MQDLYTEKYKALLKEMKEDLDKWKDILCSHIGSLNRAIIPKEIYRLNKITIKISLPSPHLGIGKLILKFTRNCKEG